MKNILELNKIQFGKTDAFNELKEFGTEWFTKAFFPFEKYELENFMTGKSYYICGEKGTGKTALLRYLQCKLSDDPEILVIPIRFKTDLDKEDKKTLTHVASNVRENTAEGWEGYKDDFDAVLVWQIYMLNKLFEVNKNYGEYLFFQETKELEDIKLLLNIIYPEYKTHIFPKLKRGKVTLNTNILKMIDAELQIEIGIEKTNEISFSQIAKSIMNKFKKLRYQSNKAYIIFDELELSVHSQKEHNRDIKLVRDLIIAIDRFNEVCKISNFDIHVISAVRSEVIKSVYCAGHEVNKSIEDYGVMISWYQRGGGYKDNRLLRLIENKVKACEEMQGITEHGDIWEKYFPSEINGIPIQKYILNYSWMHPRDIVRLMNCVLKQYNGESKFTQEMFDRAMKNYSLMSWNEIMESLRLKYSEKEISFIKLVFTNIQVPFTFKAIKNRIQELEEIDDEFNSFLKKHSLKTMLEDLFECGVIGNSGQRMIFKFMEDDDLAITEDMIIHKPLRNFFAVKSRPKNQDDIYNEI